MVQALRGHDDFSLKHQQQEGQAKRRRGRLRGEGNGLPRPDLDTVDVNKDEDGLRTPDPWKTSAADSSSKLKKQAIPVGNAIFSPWCVQEEITEA